MAETNQKTPAKTGSRVDIRFKREAKALQKNLEKRKKQQEARKKLLQKSDSE